VSLVFQVYVTMNRCVCVCVCVCHRSPTSLTMLRHEAPSPSLTPWTTFSCPRSGSWLKSNSCRIAMIWQVRHRLGRPNVGSTRWWGYPSSFTIIVIAALALSLLLVLPTSLDGVTEYCTLVDFQCHVIVIANYYWPLFSSGLLSICSVINLCVEIFFMAGPLPLETEPSDHILISATLELI
jgi:hypothetical protein